MLYPGSVGKSTDGAPWFEGSVRTGLLGKNNLVSSFCCSTKILWEKKKKKA